MTTEEHLAKLERELDDARSAIYRMRRRQGWSAALLLIGIAVAATAGASGLTAPDG